MYKVIGADQKQYGPVSADLLRQWLAQGRANAATRVQAEGSSEWVPLAQIAEFADVFQAASATQPSIPGLPSAPVPAAKTSKTAIWSLIMGILGVFTCGVTALVGLGLGIVSLVKIGKSGGELKGQGLAIAGMVISALLLISVPFVAALGLPALAKAKQRAQTIDCMNHMKQIDLALIMYANDNKQFPPAAAWCDLTTGYLGPKSATILKCGAADANVRSHYAMNAALANVPLNQIQSPAQTVLTFETDGGWNLAGGPELLLKNFRHGGVVLVGFADGHCEAVSRGRLNRLNWQP